LPVIGSWTCDKSHYYEPALKLKVERILEPLTNYFVGRLKQSVLKRNSTVGLIATAVNRWNSNTAYVGGLDWDLRFANDMYQITGTLAGSQ